MAYRAASRRALFAGAAVAAGTVLAGCGGVSRLLATIHPPTLTLPFPPLLGWATAVQQAWQRVGLRFHLRFLAEGDTTGRVDADWVAVPGAGGDVGPDLSAINFNPASLTPTAVHAFTAADGNLFALPVALGEYQFYVNSARLKTWGIADRAQWTWDEMTGALAASQPHGFLIGWGWDDPRLWSAVATGLEGNLLLPDGHLDWQKATAATQALVGMAHGTGAIWSGTTEPGDVETNLPSFVTSGFSLPPGFSTPDPLYQPFFAFAPPWNMELPIFAPHYVPFIPGSCSKGGMCALSPRPFPTFPKGSPIPGLSWGLAPRATTNQPLLGEFATWLYRSTQQTVLLTLGFAPLTADESVQGTWVKQQASVVSTAPRFDSQRYFDIAAALPIGFWSGAWSAAVLNLTVHDSTAKVATEMEYIRENISARIQFPDRPSPANLWAVK